jgi:hypothetical protein
MAPIGKLPGQSGLSLPEADLPEAELTGGW